MAIPCYSARWLAIWRMGGGMGSIRDYVGPVLVWAVLGGLAAFVLGTVALSVLSALGRTEGSRLMGYAIGLLFFWIPLGAVIGAGLGVASVRRRKRP